MIKKQLLSKTLSAAMFAAAMLFGSSAVFAQVKIGTNPTAIEATSNLEVEGSTAGRKVKVNKTTGQVTIADGTQGAGRVLTSDANGGASWVAGSKVGTINGTLPSTVSGWSVISQFSVMVKSGASITLPPGKWLVFWRCTYINNTNSDAQIWWDLTPLSAGYTFGGAGASGRGLSSMALVDGYAPSTTIYDVAPTATTTYYMWGAAGGLHEFTSGQLTYSGEGRLFAIPVDN